MFSNRLGCALGTGLWLHTVAAAQDPAELARRLARLDVLRQQAAARRATVDSVRRNVLDTVRTGSLVILVLPEDAGTLRRGAELAWPRLDSLYGDEASTLANPPMLFWIQTRPIRYPPPAVSSLQAVVTAVNATPEDVARQLMSGAASIMRARSDTVLSNWTGPLLMPMSNPRAELGRVYVELVTAPSVAVRRCYQGTAADCRAAVGLIDGGDPVALWFDAAERRALVRKTTELYRLNLRAASEACLVGHSDADCIVVLHALPYLDAPLSTEARHSFARTALAEGGRGAYGRLIRSTGRPLSERFAIAAGLPSDSLALRWRSTILAARPKTVTLAAAGGWMALGWAVAFGLIALRSTRWR